MHNLFALLLFFSFTAQAQDIDSELANYIKEFEMQPMEAPASKREKMYELGGMLFRDHALAGKNNITCQHCHMPGLGTGDGLPLGLGEGSTGMGPRRRQNNSVILPRNTPAVFNLGVSGASHLFWDGRVSKDENGHWVSPEAGLNGENPALKEIAATLDSVLALQALFPIASPEEMLGQGSLLSREEAWKNAVTRLMNGPRAQKYAELFKESFGVEASDVNIGHVGNALAEFQRHAFWAGETPWDNYLKGNLSALSDEAKKGAVVFFNKGQCANCHNGMQMSAFDFDAVGVPQLGLPGTDDLGRMSVTGLEEDRYMFRVPPLRNIAVTAPYMHNGVFKDLWEVIEHYDAPEKFLMDFIWQDVFGNYNTALTLDRTPENQLARLTAMAEDLPRDLKFTKEEEESLWCFLTVGLTDKKYQAALQGVENENPRCTLVR